MTRLTFLWLTPFDPIDLIEEMSVAYYKAVDDAENLIGRINSKFSKERVYRSRTNPVIGAHTGPNLLVVAVLGDNQSALHAVSLKKGGINA